MTDNIIHLKLPKEIGAQAYSEKEDTKTFYPITYKGIGDVIFNTPLPPSNYEIEFISPEDPYENETIQETGARARALLSDMQTIATSQGEMLDKIQAHLNLKAMCVEACNKSSEMAEVAKLKIAGL